MTAVLFIAPLAEFDQKLLEDITTNRYIVHWFRFREKETEIEKEEVKIRGKSVLTRKREGGTEGVEMKKRIVGGIKDNRG